MTIRLVSIEESRVKRPYLRARTLKRNPSFRPIEQDDLRWLYVAYRRGGFQNVLPEGLESADINRAIGSLLLPAKETFVLEAPNTENAPIGVVMCGQDGHRVQIDPHFFPWASTRNVVETMVKFLQEMRDGYEILWTVPKEEKRLAEQMCKYGVLRRVGVIEHWFGPSSPAMFFEGKMHG